VTVEEYLAELRHHLRVGPLTKRRILREVREHLEDATQADREAAEGRAIERLGAPVDLAARFGDRRRRIGFAVAFAVVIAAVGGTAVGLAVGLGESVDPQLQATARAYCGGANASRKCIQYVYDHADRYSHLDMRTGLVMLVSGRPGGAVTFTTADGARSACVGQLAVVQPQDGGLVFQCRGQSQSLTRDSQ
jgi:hypothetical protein